MKRPVDRAVPCGVLTIVTLTLCLSASVQRVSALESGRRHKGSPTGEKASPAVRQLVGAWRLTSDDDTPGKVPPPEVITFRAVGTWQVAGNGEPFSGRFRVEGDEVVMIMVVDGNTQVRRRRYRLDDQGLHFANEKPGFAHYVRVTP